MTEHIVSTDHLANRIVATSETEFTDRRRRVLDAVAQRGCDLFVGFDASTIRYLTGYILSAAERPFAVILDKHGEVTLLAPVLKEADARATARCDHFLIYQEYPGTTHPMAVLAAHVAAGSGGGILAETDGYTNPHGYHGPLLTSLVDKRVIVDRRIVQTLRMVKSTEEIALLRHASDWAVHAHWLLQKATEAGRTESYVSGKASGSANQLLRQYYGTLTKVDRPMVVSAGFGGQIGAAGTAHHIQRGFDRTITAGDMLITKVLAWVGGYYSDVERTMVCRPNSADASDLFRLGLEIQLFALDLIKPGTAVRDIDRAVFDRLASLKCADRWRHHVGHSVGLLEREEPYLDMGSDIVLEPGMVITVEPGVYRDGVGGFRHSDTVLVTERGMEMLTEYPRDLSSLLC